MKKLILIIFLCASFFVKAQDTLLKYYDNNWKTVSKEKASYYRKYKKNIDKTWMVNDFFLNGNIQMTGTFNKKNFKEKEGDFVYYFKNGKKNSEGNYKNNLRTGEWNYYYETGELRSKEQYDNQGQKTGLFIEWYQSGKCRSEGNYTNNKRENEWKWYFENGQVSSKEIYKQDELIDKIFWNEDGTKIKGELKVMVKPEFVGGEKALLNYIRENVKYPEPAKSANITGKVFIQFVVNIDGSVEDVIVLKSVNPFLDEEAIRAVKSMPKWTIAKHHNLPVKVSFQLPINFLLY